MTVSSSRPAAVVTLVMMSCTPLSDSRAPRWLRNSLGAGPVGAFVRPAGEGGAQLEVDRDLADLLALADDAQDALAHE